MSYCRRCTNNKFGVCTLGFNKSDKQLQNENYKCFSERILKVYDTDETKPDLLIEKGPYGDMFTASEIDREIKRLNRLRNGILAGAEV